MNFDAIFGEYYALYRGQATSLPVYGDAEYNIAIQLGNNAIRKWDRADAEEWNELKTTLQTAIPAQAVAATIAIPTMRKPPKRIFLSGGGHFEVIGTDKVDDYTSLNGLAWFTGSANTGFTLHLGGDLSQVTGQLVDFPFIRKPVMLPTATSPAATIVDMSDPNFLIQDMLASRAANSRNGFLYKTAKSDAKIALQDMKIENHSGTAGNSINLFDGQSSGQWGRGRNGGVTNNAITL